MPLPIHKQYGGPLPGLPCVRLEENMAEKIARLNRTTAARDVYDLVWLLGTYRREDGQQVDTALVRRLAVLKIWVDAHGLNAPDTHWKPGHDSADFDPASWLRQRPSREFDHEDIGQLAVPTPDLATLGGRMRELYAFLADLSPQEAQIARANAGDRDQVLAMLGHLPDSRVSAANCW